MASALATDLATDVAIIGAGTAGMTAFSQLRRRGVDAVLIDRGPLGTTCARVGCMPSKAVLHVAHQWSVLRALLKDAAVPAAAGTVDQLWLQARARRDVLAGKTEQQTRKLAGERLIIGQARFTGPETLSVDGREIRARAFIVATGSTPIVPQSLASLGDRLLTTDSLFELESLPSSIGILGLGAIGLEMGLALSRVGLRVTGGDMKPMLAGIADPEIAARALACFGGELTMWLGRPLEARAQASGIALRSGDDTAEVEMVLAALGRRANVDSLDLAKAGVALDERGLPVFDPQTLRAGASRIFLAGDVSGLRPLMHEAGDEGAIAARGAAQLLDGRAVTLPARRTPIGIVFSDPDIAFVGLPYDALDLDTTVIGSAEGKSDARSRVIEGENNLVRLYIDRASRKLLGASLIAARGEHLAHLLAWSIQRGETLDDLLEMPYYHPCIEEMIQSALKHAARQMRTSG